MFLFRCIIYNPHEIFDENGFIPNGSTASNVFYWLPGIIYCKTKEDVFSEILRMSL
jgi:hypothetical protein